MSKSIELTDEEIDVLLDVVADELGYIETARLNRMDQIGWSKMLDYWEGLWNGIKEKLERI